MKTMSELDEAKQLLLSSGWLFEREESQEDFKTDLVINLNDTWAWAYACCEKIPDEDAIEVARLFRHYGYCGILYWAAQKQGITKPEFQDNWRFIEFVRNEEAILKEFPDSNKRAYAKRAYTLGETQPTRGLKEK